MEIAKASRLAPRWMSWAEWKAEALNRLFQKYGVLKQRGCITAETVRHGERAANEDRETNKLYPGELRTRSAKRWPPRTTPCIAPVSVRACRITPRCTAGW